LIKQEPKAFVLHTALAAVLVKQCKIDEAILCYRQAIQLDSTVFSNYYHLGELLEKQGDLESAIDSYRQAIRANPNYLQPYHKLIDLWSDLDTYLQLGEILVSQNRLNEAIAIYQMAMIKLPDTRVCLRLADTLWKLGNFLIQEDKGQQAVHTYANAIQLHAEILE
jgi:tetratricopeptide (TPR) repeat protein